MKYVNCKKNLQKLPADLDISGPVFEAMKSRIVLLEPTLWSNNQYSRHKFLEMYCFHQILRPVSQRELSLENLNVISKIQRAQIK